MKSVTFLLKYSLRKASYETKIGQCVSQNLDNKRILIKLPTIRISFGFKAVTILKRLKRSVKLFHTFLISILLEDTSLKTHLITFFLYN